LNSGPIAAVVGLVQVRHPLAREAACQQAGVHRAVDDHSRAVLGCPRDHVSRRVAVDQRQRRLDAVDVAHGLAAIEQGDAEVGCAYPADHALVDQLGHGTPGVLGGEVVLARPVDLQQVDPVDAESPQRVLGASLELVRSPIARR
jgi:hypothetical protein